MSSSLHSALGPSLIEWGAFHFIAPDDDARAADLDDHDGPSLLNRYCLPATLHVAGRSFSVLPSVVGLCCQVLAGIKAVARREAATIYLVEDGEFSLQLAPATVGSELCQLQLCGPSDALTFWHESADRLIFEMAAILHAMTKRCSEANVPVEELLKRCPSEVGWYLRE